MQSEDNEETPEFAPTQIDRVTDDNIKRIDDEAFHQEETVTLVEQNEDITSERMSSIIEGLLLLSDDPLQKEDLIQFFYQLRKSQNEDQDNDSDNNDDTDEDIVIAKMVSQKFDEAINILLQKHSDNEGIYLAQVANGYQLRTNTKNQIYLQRYFRKKPIRISASALETLSIIAYQQPIVKADIDTIRGVDSSGMLKTLLDKELIKILGKKDEPGRPLLYGTTQKFLEFFHLQSLGELPTIQELKELVAASRPDAEQVNFRFDDNISAGQEYAQKILEEDQDVLERIDSAIKDVQRAKKLTDTVLEIKSSEEEEATSDTNPDTHLSS